ncbi:hypothetical protein [Leucobacter soli]|uniref:hypothetical protein n=1 Tax=Leucobacter soli TaxID=2812850 RepID=UPI00360F2D6B
MLALGVVGLLLIGAAGSVAVAMSANEAKAELVAEQQRGAALRAERAQYAEVTEVNGELETARAAQAIALYAEVDWAGVTREFTNALPSGADASTLNLGQRLSPGVGSVGVTSTSEANPLSSLSVIFIEYRVTSTSADTGAKLLDRLESRMTGFEWATQTSASVDKDGGYAFTGLIRLGVDAVGTSRAKDIDEATLDALRESLTQASLDETTTTGGVQ